MKCGFASIIGVPNAGKSTLINQILGFKLAITSKKPQTTRQRILGIYSDKEMQAILLDSPGIHPSTKLLNKFMQQATVGVINESDIVLFLHDSATKISSINNLLPFISQLNKPIILVLNKIDLIKPKDRFLPLIEQVNKLYKWEHIIPVSAKNGNNISELLKYIKQLLPDGPFLFPADEITDLSERFLASELIREKIIRNTAKELPYSTAVTIDEFRESTPENATIFVQATIHVERESQKAIIIGKQGLKLKQIGSLARIDLERLLANNVFLRLHVKVDPKWTQSNFGLQRLGYE